MTLTIRDCSDFDADPINLAGLSALTHKATEGTSIVHQQYGPRLNAWRGQVPVLGSYHVVRTPGSGGAGSLANQLQFWVSRMDSQTPWWRDYPWILQIDAERWSYDNVQPSTVLAFADLVAKSGLPGWKVTYASHGEYGDSLTGLATPLWNADYRAGTYPGDAAVATDKGSPGFWAPYSGQTPALLQWNGGPDLNAYRGSLDQLLALTTGGNVVLTKDDILAICRNVARVVQSGATADYGFMDDPIGQELAARAINPDPTNGGNPHGTLYTLLNGILAAQSADATRDAAMLAAIQALSAGGTSIDTTAVLSAVKAVGDAESAAVTALQQQLAAAQQAIAHLEAQLAASGHALES